MYLKIHLLNITSNETNKQTRKSKEHFNKIPKTKTLSMIDRYYAMMILDGCQTKFIFCYTYVFQLVSELKKWCCEPWTFSKIFFSGG